MHVCSPGCSGTNAHRAFEIVTWKLLQRVKTKGPHFTEPSDFCEAKFWGFMARPASTFGKLGSSPTGCLKSKGQKYLNSFTILIMVSKKHEWL